MVCGEVESDTIVSCSRKIKLLRVLCVPGTEDLLSLGFIEVWRELVMMAYLESSFMCCPGTYEASR